MKTILVPTDFSETARNATFYAASLAEELSCRLQLLHVYSMPLSPPGEVPGALMIDTVELEKDVNEKLRSEAASLKGKTGAEVSYRSVSGFVIDEILQAESKEQPDLIVMGIHEEGPVSEFLFGSATTDLLDKLHTPLLVVPLHAEFKVPGRVAIADDYNESTMIHFPHSAIEMLNTFKSRIYVVRVVDAEKSETEKIAADKRIEKLFGDAFHSYHFVEEDNVAEGLTSFINAHQTDILIMHPRPHGFLGNLFGDRTTRKMAFHSKIPLLALPAKEK